MDCGEDESEEGQVSSEYCVDYGDKDTNPNQQGAVQKVSLDKIRILIHFHPFLQMSFFTNPPPPSCQGGVKLSLTNSY